jgi:hypothetical protein
MYSLTTNNFPTFTVVKKHPSICYCPPLKHRDNTVLFGCEAWSMTEKGKTRLNMWERKILRKVHGPVTEQEVWRIKRNEELRELYKAPDLVVDIKRKQLEWLGHVIRMDQ